MISDKTVGILTRMREKCEEICQRDISAEECAETLDILTDIMDMLMTANSIEQGAIMAKGCGDNMNKDQEAVN